MNRLWNLLILGAGAYLLWKAYEKYQGEQPVVQPMEATPPGSMLTGRRMRTTNGGRPGEVEVIGYGIRDFLEINMPSGEKSWIEVKLVNPFAGK